MRPLEITLAAILAASILASAALPGRRSAGSLLALLPLLAVGVATLQLHLETYRWQMVPLYLLTALEFLGLMVGELRRRAAPEPNPADESIAYPPSKPARRRGAPAWKALLFLVAVALPYLLPVPRLPAPTGPYSVGRLTLEMVDQSRQEIYSDDPDEKRALMVQLWYPAQAPGDQPGRWMDDLDVIGPTIAAWLNLPSFALDHLQLARTHAYPGAAPAASPERFPVLLFSHGWNGFRVQNTFQTEELASHGYVVVAVEHTYAAQVTVFPDGRVARHNPAGLPSGVSESEYLNAANRLVLQWAHDLSFVLNELATRDASDPDGRLTGRLDLAQVGVFGHSTGGGAAVEFCSKDYRCAAGLAMDAYLVPVSEHVINSGIEQPFLFMNSELWQIDGNNARFARLYNQMNYPVYQLTLAGTGHYDFTDLRALSPLTHMLGLKGPASTGRVMRVINDYSLAFFDEYLKGEPAHLLEGPSPDYPEVDFQVRGMISF